MRVTAAPWAAIPTQSHEPTPSSSRARPGTYSDGSSKPEAAALISAPSTAAPSARVKARVPRARGSKRWHPLEGVADDVYAITPGGVGSEQEPVREHACRQGLHVVGQRVVAALERGERLGGLEQHQARARAGAELGARVG